MRAKPIEITSLAMRFYRSVGWEREHLEPYLAGKLVLRGFGPNEELDQYYILDVGSRLDIDRMVADGVIGSIHGKESWGELRGLSDIEALKRRNW